MTTRIKMNSFSVNTNLTDSLNLLSDSSLKTKVLTVGSSADQVNDLQPFIVEYVQ